MTNEEAKVFLDNLKICIDEHPIVADWLVEVADRKTEPTEPQKDCKKCKNYDRCKNNRWKCCVYEPKDEPNSSEIPNNSKVSEIPTGSEPQTERSE